MSQISLALTARTYISRIVASILLSICAFGCQRDAALLPSQPQPAVSEPHARISFKDAFFDFDRSDIRPDAASVLRENAAAIERHLEDYPTAEFVIEGHTDQRGSYEYNLAIGERMAAAAKDYLVDLGVPASKLFTVGMGEERVVCTEAKESCYQQNRRVRLRLREP